MCVRRLPALCPAAVSGHGGGDSSGEVWVQVPPDLPPPPPEEDPGAEAGGGHGHDPRQGGQGAPLLTAGRELCNTTGVCMLVLWGDDSV